MPWLVLQNLLLPLDLSLAVVNYVDTLKISEQFSPWQ